MGVPTVYRCIRQILKGCIKEKLKDILIKEVMNDVFLVYIYTFKSKQ